MLSDMQRDLRTYGSMSTRTLIVRYRSLLGALWLIVGGCVTFRGEPALVQSDESAVEKLQRLEGVWIGKMQSKDAARYEAEYIVRVFQARDDEFAIAVNLYDPKRKDKVRNAVFDVEVLEANGGLVVFAVRRGIRTTDGDSFVFFLQVDGRRCKAFFNRQPQPMADRREQLQMVLRSREDIARIKKDPFQLFSDDAWIAFRFVDTTSVDEGIQWPSGVRKIRAQ